MYEMQRIISIEKPVLYKISFNLNPTFMHLHLEKTLHYNLLVCESCFQSTPYSYVVELVLRLERYSFESFKTFNEMAGKHLLPRRLCNTYRCMMSQRLPPLLHSIASSSENRVAKMPSAVGTFISAFHLLKIFMYISSFHYCCSSGTL